MTKIETILGAILLVSMVFNVGIIVYTRAAIARLLSVSEELGDLQAMVDSFSGHLGSVYELEMFYGDPTLQNLLNHAVSFNEQLETFEYIYNLTEEEDDDNKYEETDDETS